MLTIIPQQKIIKPAQSGGSVQVLLVEVRRNMPFDRPIEAPARARTSIGSYLYLYKSRPAEVQKKMVAKDAALQARQPRRRSSAPRTAQPVRTQAVRPASGTRLSSAWPRGARPGSRPCHPICYPFRTPARHKSLIPHEVENAKPSPSPPSPRPTTFLANRGACLGSAIPRVTEVPAGRRGSRSSTVPGCLCRSGSSGSRWPLHWTSRSSRSPPDRGARPSGPHQLVRYRWILAQVGRREPAFCPTVRP